MENAFKSEQPSAVDDSRDVGSITLATSSSNSQAEPSLLSMDERFALVRSVGEECIQEDELRNLLEKKSNPICYDGFEPSGRMHIAQGVMKTINVNKLTSAGCTVKIWIADWFAQMNNKMGGDLKKIRKIGEYFIEIWKAAGMKTERVEFLWSSNEINSRSDEYLPLLIDIVRMNTLLRIVRCCQIMGRSEQDELTATQIFYPCMQCADIFFLKADICQLGMDQRKVNMLAREYCVDIKKKNKPIILSHHMLPGLQQGQEKMSKSDPSSSIYMEDEEAEVNVKIKKAYCPPKIVEGNPCLEYIKYIIFPWFHKFDVIRQEENGGNKIYACMDELISDYESGALHPTDVKPALSKALNEILQPVRDHFKKSKEARELLKTVKMMAASKEDFNLASNGVPGGFNSSGSPDICTGFMENAFKFEQPSAVDDTPDVGSITLATSSSNSQAGPSLLSIDERFALVRSVGEECIQEDELQNLLKKKPNPICYDGFEPSGRMHIAQGVMKTINVNKLTSAGCIVKIWIADWFALLNNKMGGDLKKIHKIGEYFIEIWKAAGMKIERVEFLWSSNEINSRSDEYLSLLIDIGVKNTLPRIVRCSQIMGRSEQDELTAAQIFYPCMQCADIFFLKVDICQLGMDQRKVNMLAREYCDDIKKKNKPIILSHRIRDAKE